MAGGVFFSSGGYTALLQVVNAPPAAAGGGFEAEPWRWGALEWGRLEWLGALVLFVGTLVFAINLVDSFIANLTAAQENRLTWSPDMIGCALFLVSGHLAMVAISGTWLPCRRPGELGWWIVAANQLGSIFFAIAAVASLVHRDGDLVAAAIANWGTLTGALCFAIAGVMQRFERPEPA